MSGLTQRTSCIDCGHRHDLHCTSTPRFHWPAGSATGFFMCLLEHCEARVWDGKETHPCGCTQFRATLAAKIKLKRPRADGWTPCARCSHPKQHHCVKGRPGFTVGYKSYVCSHFDQELNPVNYECTDGHCAEADESTEEFCGCPGFVNPFLIRKAKAPRKKKVAVEAQIELFPLIVEAAPEAPEVSL